MGAPVPARRCLVSSPLGCWKGSVGGFCPQHLGQRQECWRGGARGFGCGKLPSGLRRVGLTVKPGLGRAPPPPPPPRPLPPPPPSRPHLLRLVPWHQGPLTSLLGWASAGARRPTGDTVLAFLGVWISWSSFSPADGWGRGALTSCSPDPFPALPGSLPQPPPPPLSLLGER